LETRARARLAGHKFIVDAVQSFRNKYPDWKLCLTDLLNELGSKQRAKNKPNDNKVAEKNKKTSTNVKEFEVAEYNSDGSTENDGYKTHLNESDISLEKIQSDHLLHTESNDESEENQDTVKPVISSKTIVKNKSLSKSNETTLQVSKIKEKKLPKIIANPETNKSNDNINGKLNKKTFKRKSKQNVPIKIENKKKRIIEDEIKPICETVDSFFITANDKDYMSVYKPLTVTERKLEDPKPIKEIFIKEKKVTVGKNNSMSNRKERRQQKVEEQVDTSLHPSWEAKRKQKSLAKFEGKKITFDDQD
jgi:hypothetical protein